MVDGLLSGVVDRVECRPFECRRGDLFCVFPEFHTYQRWWTVGEILDAVADRGIAGMIGPLDMPNLGVPQWKVDAPVIACARLARALYGHPGPAVPIVGVTGTNGKTTTVKLLAHLSHRMGTPAADFGTLGISLDGKHFCDGEYTTDLAVELHRKLSAVQAAGAKFVAMEVSSHALALERVAAVDFKAAILTNLTRDHLEFHGTAAAYKSAKRRLFERLRRDAIAVINVDDEAAVEFSAATQARVITFGAQSWADLHLVRAEFSPLKTDFEVRWEGQTWSASTALVGAFQLHNILGAVATLLGLGHHPHAIFEALPTFEAVAGRMERIPLPNGATVVIDYAHNPDGLEHVLRSCQALAPQRLRVVFGCGGDRDRGKRPLMGAVAEKWSDDGWVTSDNPRTEDPSFIVGEIVAGIVHRERFPVVLDRRVAIETALHESAKGDVILLAGKGHEDYQIIGTEKRPFSDHQVVRQWIQEHSGTAQP